ncbi:MAG TPA: prepilin-type N-terminal cleavage/methylation domain-containing protein, partial [Candidatus Paceibacterota bacterium]|nr:prepilin-type N-terminal cleavage/methylation domain-containing protein [Candidatus Paceibacterota bacterium]
MRKYNTKKSFTLVELMIVIAILAILSAIVIFA